MCFPSLKLLDISIRHLDGDFFQKLFSSCPVLEDLSIDGELDNNVGVVTFDIMVPTLKRLSICLYIDVYHFEGVYNHKFVVTASNLEYLNFGCHLLPSFVVNGRLLLNEVCLDVRISSYVCMDARYGWKLLPHFLNSSSNLEVLILKMDCNQEYLPEQFVQFESWSVPCCLRLHVKKIEIRNMMGDEDVLEVIGYMLKNSEVLESFPWTFQTKFFGAKFLLERKVRKLNIRVFIDDDELWVVRLPQSILTCNTLVELCILSDFVFDIPDSTTCFPSLKLLYISITNPHDDLLQKLFRSCPVLEDLSIHGNLFSNEDVLMFDIMVPTLKRLTIWVSMDFYYFEGVSEHKFVVTASKLEYLNIGDYLLASFVVNERPLLNQVSLDVGVDSSLVEDYSQLDEFEVFHDEANRSLNLGFDDNIPTFPNLIRLEMCIEARFSWKLLPHFLNSSSNLEVLILKMDYNQEYSPEEFVQFESENVPSCLRLHVKMIEIRNMTGVEDELEVVSYMLKNSEVLKEFSVDIANAESKENLQRQILLYPRGSVDCEIKFL
ncbi:hypothetical protein LWI29_027471 [Acer saccharum]|uniref:FBD domain-containing protein n=1 Tax=Acer saccharum TaxID=4024 RepID=A0AA39S4K4_ACESA|nr:hypothetical protein LWI29_027471 [Acer saccharum]